MSKGVKMPPAQGDDGRLYFNFGVGSQYVFYPDNGEKPFAYLITDCELVGDTEYYKIYSNGKPIPRPISANRLKYLLSIMRCELKKNGEQLEFPLLKEEVRTFYKYLNAERAAARDAAKKVLKKTEYGNLNKEINALSAPIAFAEYRGEIEKASQLKKEQERKRAALVKILADNQIAPDVLSESPRCRACGDSGILSNLVICDCARERTDEIKAFCAAERLQRKAR